MSAEEITLSRREMFIQQAEANEDIANRNKPPINAWITIDRVLPINANTGTLSQ
jgi:hypothetical protein